MNFNMNMSKKIGTAFFVLTVLVMTCGAAGYYGVNQLSQSLYFISGPAWDAADGSMEGSIGIQAQMLSGEELFAGLADVASVREEIEKGGKMADEALARMIASGLLSDAEIRRLGDIKGKYDDVKQRVVNLFVDYDVVNKRLEANLFDLQALMTHAEILGDGAVEVLKENPNLEISWDSGLEEKWNAADGAMETQIGLLKKVYFYTRLINFKDVNTSLAGISEAQEMIDEASSRIMAYPEFKKGMVPNGRYAGQNYTRALSQAISANEIDFKEAIEKFQVYAKVRQEYEGVTAKLLVVLEENEVLGDSKVEGEMEKIASVIDFSNSLIILVGIFAVIASVLMGYFLIRAITLPLQQAIRVADRIANGNLDNKIDVKSDDETGKLLMALKTMNEKLFEIVDGARKTSSNVATGAAQISVGNLSLSQRTEEQASSLEETASSMEEMTSTVKQNADNANQASQLAQTARDQAEAGGVIVSQAVTAMGEINQSSSKIADIISVVEEIAFQTNLLALNAAVEAARAGEQGRGFAVVASEVRVLAGRSSDAAKEIKGLIEDSVGKVKAGSDLVDKSGETLQEIVTGVKKVTDIVFEIAAASQEQSAGIDQVNTAVTQMDEMTQQNASLVEEAASASKSLEDQASQMNDQMAFFNLGDAGGYRQGMAHEIPRVHGAIPHKALAQNVPAGQVQHQPEPVLKTVAQGARANDGSSWEDF